LLVPQDRLIADAGLEVRCEARSRSGTARLKAQCGCGPPIRQLDPVDRGCDGRGAARVRAPRADRVVVELVRRSGRDATLRL
jgi:hypothetical protein